MNIKQFEATKRSTYAQLASVTAAILLAAIGKYPELRLQNIQHRAKTVDSLKRKLKGIGKLRTKKLEEVVKDLGGCRLVFYTNKDVSAFLNSRIMIENFEIDWDRTKIHHPNPNSDNASDLFISHNYVVRLRPERSALPEYAHVAGFWCEVQVQTMLNHAWAETAHDTIYKKPDLPPGYGASMMKSIEDRMGKIQKDYLIPAGYEFAKVQADFERLSSGKRLFDDEALETIATTEDNNERYELLERFSEYVLPHHDDLEAAYPDVLNAMIRAVEKARARPTAEISTILGAFPGYDATQFSAKAADVIDRLKYVDAGATFDGLLRLYRGSRSEEERERWVQSGEKLSDHDLHVWQAAGPAAQDLIIGKIQDLSVVEKEDVRQLIIRVLAKALGTEITGTTSAYNTITLHRGSVQFSKPLRKIRSAALDELKALFLSAKDSRARQQVFVAMHAATRISGEPGFGQPMHLTVLEDAKEVVDFFRKNAGLMSFELKQHVEHDFLWLHRHNQPPDSKVNESSDIKKARTTLLQSILKFRDTVNDDDDFRTYKILVGFESVFPLAWSSDPLDVEGDALYRSQQIDALVAKVDLTNADDWYRRLLRCAETESQDLATFPSFAEFLTKLGKRQPDILFGFLEKGDPRLVRFLTSMLLGLESTDQENQSRTLIGQWIAAANFLPEIAWSFRSVQMLGIDLAKHTLEIAMDTDDRASASIMIAVADSRYVDWGEDVIVTILIPAIEHLASKGETRWVNQLWSLRSQTSVFGALSSKHAQAVLRALVSHTDLNWREEDLLYAVARRHPEAVMDFFEQRLAFEPGEKSTRYSAIPFQFYRLQEILSEEPAMILRRTMDWFAADARLFQYRGGKLVANIFPQFSEPLGQALLAYARSQDRQRREFAVKVLRSYEGQTFIHDLAKEIVAASERSDVLLDELGDALDATGVVSGEFGFVDAYQAKRLAMTGWLNDTRVSVKVFAKRQTKSLDRAIAAEQRRAEDDAEQRKRDWGGVEEDSKPE